MNRHQLRAKFKIKNSDIDRLLTAIGEKPTINDFSDLLVKKIEDALKEEQLKANTPDEEDLKQVLKLLAPLEENHLKRLKDAHTIIVQRALKQFITMQDELLAEELQNFADSGGWQALEARKPIQLDPTTVDVEATSIGEETGNDYWDT